jgi:hypothetical protein
MVETPTSTAFRINEPASDDDENLDSPDSDESTLLFQQEKSLDKSPPAEPELLIVRQKPITAKICTTMRHLRAQAGPWSGFRGFSLALVYYKLHQLLFLLLSRFSSGLITEVVAYVMTSVALCGLEMTWTHIVISAPSTRRWWRRIPSFDRMKVIIIPTAICAIAEQACLYVPLELFNAFGLGPYAEDPSLLRNATHQVQKEVIMKTSFVVLAPIVIGFLILIPATITLRRVQASMLPDEDEAIIPFDRTFGGKVQPVVAGGSGAVSMLDAWRTFDRGSRIRYLKLQAKIFAISMCLTAWFIVVFAWEMKLFGMGEKISAMIERMSVLM